MTVTVLVWVIVAVAVGLDLLTKYLIKSNMVLGDTIPLIEDVLHITYVENKGAAFSMLSDKRWIFMVITAAAIVAIIVGLVKYSKKLSVLFNAAFAMVLGGAIGNMVDRTFNGERLFDGAVVDFIDFRIINFAVFNVADICVCVGAGLIMLATVLDEMKEKKKKSSPEKGSSEENA